MKKYVKVDSAGYIVSSVDSPIPQPDMIELKAHIPDKPGNNYKYNVFTGTWDYYVDESVHIHLVKETRAKLLSESDWTQLPDVPLQTKQAWAEYRQALRDITDQPGYPFDIVWPQAPN